MRHIIYFLSIILMTSACSVNLPSTDIQPPQEYLYSDGFSNDTLSMGCNWWENFDDTMLNCLIEEALQGNQDLQIAASRIAESQAKLGIARAEFLPSLGATLSAEGERLEGETTQEYALEGTLDWEISLFGALRNTNRAAQASLHSLEWAREGIELSLAAQVATTYYTMIQYERALNIAQRTYYLREDSATLIDSMVHYGLSDGIALWQARSLQYQAKADIDKYSRALEAAELSMWVLLGHMPHALDNCDMGMVLLEDRIPVDIPIGLPSSLLERRPDIISAYFEMQSAAAEVGIARADRFPSITISASGGRVGTSLFGNNGWGWSAAASIVEPIFAFGKLRRAEQVAIESYNQSLLSYEKCVIKAISEVETALMSIDKYRSEIDATANLVLANNSISTKSNALYDSGMSSYLNVIDSERELYESQLDFIVLLTEQYINYIELYKALGGGW